MKAKVTAKNSSMTMEIIETQSVRISKEAHSAAKLHVARGGSRNIFEYISNLIITDPKRKK